MHSGHGPALPLAPRRPPRHSPSGYFRRLCVRRIQMRRMPWLRELLVNRGHTDAIRGRRPLLATGEFAMPAVQ